MSSVHAYFKISILKFIENVFTKFYKHGILFS